MTTRLEALQARLDALQVALDLEQAQVHAALGLEPIAADRIDFVDAADLDLGIPTLDDGITLGDRTSTILRAN